MAHSEYYFVGEDLDALFVVIDEDFLQSDLDFISEVDQVVHEDISFWVQVKQKISKHKNDSTHSQLFLVFEYFA